MVKINSISGVLCFVEDLDRTTKFYEKLGFRLGDKTDEYIKVYVNWFWIEFVAWDKAEKTVYKDIIGSSPSHEKGAGQFVYISVANVDEFYEHIVKNGFQPISEPMDFPWGKREFVLCDPDGYKLVFFQKK